MEETTQYIVWEGIKITDWIKAIGVILGVPVTVWGIFQLFKKDKKHESKIRSLENLVKSQDEINISLKGQLSELTNQTDILHKRNLFQIDENKMTERSLKLELKKYEDETVVKFEDLQEYVLELLKGLKGPIDNQIAGFDTASKELAKNENVGFDIMIDPSLRITNLQNIKNQDLFKVFVQENKQKREEKIDSFLKLEKAVALIEYVKQELRNDVNMVFSMYQSHESQWGEAVQMIKTHLDTFTSSNISNGIPASDDPFVSELNEIFGRWYDQINSGINIRDTYFMRDNFVEPIRIACNHHTTDHRTKILLPLCTIAESAYSNIDYLRKKLKSIIDNYQVQLEKSKTNIMKSIDTLELKDDE